MVRYLILLPILCFLGACSMHPRYQLSDGKYDFRQSDTKYRKADVYVQDDSTKIFLANGKTAFSPQPLVTQYFLKRSFDLDVMTVPFKFRPATSALPSQLNTDFNGNVFIGYRMDRFRLSFKETPFGVKREYGHRAISFGGFGGLGTAALNPSTTHYKTTDEYNGFILSRGLLVMLGVNNLTVGVGVGWDYLTDRDKGIWVYQNKPWIGLTLGLNLN